MDALKERKDVLTAFEALSGQDLPALLRFAEAHGGSREDADAALELLLLWTRDVSLVKAGAEGAMANRDLKALAETAAGRMSEAALHRRHALLESARTAIGTRNGAPRLQLERLLIELCVEGR